MALDSYSHSEPLYLIFSLADNADDNEDYDELLINEVRRDTKCRAYKDTPKKNEAWKAIASKLGRPGR